MALKATSFQQWQYAGLNKVSLFNGDIRFICGSGEGEASFQLGRRPEDLAVGEILAAVRGARSATPAAGVGGTAVQNTIRTVEAVLTDAEEALTPVRGRSLGDLLQDLPVEVPD